MDQSSGHSSDDKTQPHPVDLSELGNMSFGPDWSGRTSSNISARSFDTEESGSRGGSGRQGRKDRRPSSRPSEGGFQDRRREGGGESSGFSAPKGGGRPQSSGGPRQGGGDRPPQDRRQGPRGEDSRPRRSAAPEGNAGGDDRRSGRREGRPPVFDPIVEALFYPEDIPFKALCHAMRTSSRTYELFEIARLILAKPDRFVLIIKPKDAPEDAVFHISVPDGVPFDNEKDAIAHVVSHHMELFFESEEVKVEPPKGNFAFITRCGITQELIAPPNYHKYQALLQQHFAAKIRNMPFERFQQKLESVKDEDSVQKWIVRMSTEIRYKLKEPTADAPEYFDNQESARFFLLNRMKEKVIRTADQLRLSGSMIAKIPENNPIRKSIEIELEQQQNFPLVTANNLRGRLRRMKFTIYKKGPKGVSFVCAVKRNFRDPHKVFSDSIQELISFIEAHPYISVASLPEEFLGIEVASGKRQKQEKAPEIEGVSSEEASKIVEAHELRRKQARQASAAAASEGAPAAPESTPEASIQATTEAPAEAVPHRIEVEDLRKQRASEEDAQVRKLMNSLRWLVSEGYVIEFGDGRLFANPPLSDNPEAAAQSAQEEADGEADDTPGDEAEVSEAPSPDVQASEAPSAEAEASVPETDAPQA